MVVFNDSVEVGNMMGYPDLQSVQQKILVWCWSMIIFVVLTLTPNEILFTVEEKMC
jgi:hypothetical protein